MPVVVCFNRHALGIEVAKNRLFPSFSNHFATHFAVGFSRHIWNDGSPLLFVQNRSRMKGVATAALCLVEGFTGLVFGQCVAREFGLQSRIGNIRGSGGLRRFGAEESTRGA